MKRLAIVAAWVMVLSGGALGEEFVVMPWELPPGRAERFSDGGVGLGRLKECGFTVAGFVTAGEVARCRELGMRCVVRADPALEPWGKLTDGQIEARVRHIVGGTEKDPAVLGYFLTDEPGAGEFGALGKAVAWVKKLAPGKVAYVNLFPDYATAVGPVAPGAAADVSQLGTRTYREYLERFVREVRPQVISYDNYQIQYSSDQANAGAAASYYRNLLEVRRVAQENGLPFWNIVAGAQMTKQFPPPSPANLMLQAYTTLAAGGRGVTWYTYYGGGYAYAAVNGESHRTATWSALRMVNEQVKVIGGVTQGLTSTGVYFVGEVPGGEGRLPGKWVEGVEVVGGTAAMVGEFEGKSGEAYAMVVNLSLAKSAEVKVRLKGLAWETVRVVSPVDGGESKPEGEGVWVAAGAGVLLRVK